MFWPWHMWLRWSMWRFLETWRTLQLLDCVWGDSVDVRKAKIMVLDLLDEAGKWIGHSGMVFCLVHMFNHNYLVWWSRLANIRPRLNPQHKSVFKCPYQRVFQFVPLKTKFSKHILSWMRCPWREPGWKNFDSGFVFSYPFKRCRCT